MPAPRVPLVATKAHAKRLGKATAQVERAPISGSRPVYDRARSFISAMLPIRPGRLSAALPTRSGSTPGVGTVQLYTFNLAGNALTLDGETIAIRNFWLLGFATGKDCLVFWWAGSAWALVVAC